VHTALHLAHPTTVATHQRATTHHTQALEEAAIELPDHTEHAGFSLSVNSVDRFGRQSQVNSYYAGSSLTIVVRGVDPIKQFFVAVYQKKTQYDAFNTKSGDRVGYIAKESEVAGTRLTCHRRAIASRPAMNPTNEFSCDWKVCLAFREKR
jgi:hypothetical protein